MQIEVLSAADRERPLFWTAEGSLCGDEILQRAARLAETLPDRRAATVVYDRRDRFVTALLALWMRGQTAVLPADVVMRQFRDLQADYPDIYFLADRPVETGRDGFVLLDDTMGTGSAAPPDALPDLPDAVCIFTSGSTGRPSPNSKSWDMLFAGAPPMAAMIGLDRLQAPSMVATVPSYHMYGFELTVLAVLRAGAAVHCERPVYPADVARCLQEIPPPRALVTTPFHLRALMESRLDMPEIGLIVSATAPLAGDFAARIEERFGAPVHEIYGFTEACSVAGRRTVEGELWTVRDDLAAVEEAGAPLVEFTRFGVRVPFPDRIDRVDARHIRLLNRRQDVVNVAGKRASLSGLSASLTDIDGVEDGVFYLAAPDAGQGTIARLTAVVVAPTLTDDEIRQALRAVIDPAFVPRHVLHVDRLPRNDTGKITHEALRSLVEARLKGR